MALDGRTVSKDSYRFGYQGSEKDDEVKGTGNSYTTFFRQLDSRIGRWFSVDPVFQPWQSPYCSMDGNPVIFNDVLGNYSEKKANRMAKRGEKNGYTAKVINKNGDFGVYFEKQKDDVKHFETYFKGAFKGARKSSAVALAGAPELIPWPEMTVLTGGAKDVATNVSKNIVGTLGLLAGFVLTPHAGHYPVNEMDQYRYPLTLPNPDLKDNDKDYITLYRGVSTDGNLAMYRMAQKGIAVPKGLLNPFALHNDIEDHTMGDNNTLYTSWSSDERVALTFAKGPLGNANGVIMTIRVSKSEALISKLSAMMQEQEHLLWGVRKADSVKKVP